MSQFESCPSRVADALWRAVDALGATGSPATLAHRRTQYNLIAQASHTPQGYTSVNGKRYDYQCLHLLSTNQLR